MQFSNTWFDDSELRRNVHHFLNDSDVNHILEIGSFEGASACYFSNNFLNNPKSTLTCIDPFDISDKTSPVYTGIKEIL